MLEGQIFEDKYKILKVIGQGGMGKVYLAENIKLGTFWAIKEINKKPDSKVDFLIEANILKQLNHPALPRIFDITEDDENIYVVVDYLEGVSLDKKLLEVGKFPEETVVNWAKQICDVLIYLHEHKPNPIIYRDMKPGNIILTNEGNIKLIDFGIAREYKEEALSDTIFIGTRGYAAPEQYNGSTGQTNPASDIFSLGVTLYHLLTGKGPNEPPYEFKPIRSFDQQLSLGIEIIVNKCTRLNPLERYQSVRELLSDINNIANLGKCDDTVLLEDIQNNPGTRVNGNAGQQGPPNASFRRLVLSVIGSSEFACEMAYIASKITDFKILIVNLDFTASNLDIYYNLSEFLEIKFSHDNCILGFTPVMDALKTKALNGGIIEGSSIKLADAENLYILTERFDIGNYERYRGIDISTIIETAYRNFDITIVILNDSVLDEFGKTVLGRADYNIIASLSNMDAVRKYSAYMAYMRDTHNVPFERTRFVSFEYRKDVNLTPGDIEKYFPDRSYLGYITYQPEREYFRNINNIYSKQAYKKQKEEYENILQEFNIVPKKTLMNRLNNWFSKKGSK